MKELEEKIIGSVFGDDQYKRVSFLEANDFNNYPEKPFREFWRELEKTNGYELSLITIICKSQNEPLKNLLLLNCDYIAAGNLEKYALFLLEQRFKALLLTLITELSFSSKNRLEVDLLNECQSAVINQDIFDLSDNLIDYIGHHASDNTKRRINDFIIYRDKRVMRARNVINEQK